MIRFAVLLACVASPALGAERTVQLTDFDRIRVDGAYDVTVTTGRASGARITGDARAMGAVRIEVQSRQLIIRRDTNTWGGYPGQAMGQVSIAVTVPTLTAASLAGSGRVRIDRMRAMRLRLAVEGSGELAVRELVGERLDGGLTGSGTLTLGGRVAGAALTMRGSGNLSASALIVADLVLTSESSGSVAVTAGRSAKITASGSGDVAVLGAPTCTVQQRGSGSVTCGKR